MERGSPRPNACAFAAVSTDGTWGSALSLWPATPSRSKSRLQFSLSRSYTHAVSRVKSKTMTATNYDRELANTISSRMAEGESLRAICRSPGFPSEGTVRGWAVRNMTTSVSATARLACFWWNFGPTRLSTSQMNPILIHGIAKFGSTHGNG